MPVESLFPRLEPLLPQVQKPIQYVGGELNSTIKDWDADHGPLGLMYPDAYEVGLPNQGVRSSTRCSTSSPTSWPSAPTRCGPTSRALMREHDVPQFTVDAHRPVGAFDVFGDQLRRPSSATPTCSTRSTSPASRSTAKDRTDDHPIVLAGGHARSTRSRSPTSSTPPCSATASRPCSTITAIIRDVEGRGQPRRPRRAAAAGSPRPATSTCRGSTTSTTCPTAASSASRPTGRGPVPRRQAHRHGPRRVALPQAGRWCRWPRRSTSATASRSSAAARAAAGSARPA